MIGVFSGLGDLALLFPASVLFAAYLLYRRSAKTAALLTGAMMLCAVITLVLKIGFIGWGDELPFLNIRAPSGHASFGTTFYLCSVMMLSADQDRRTRILLTLAAFALIVAIGISRVILDTHTVPEVVTGVLIGACCVVWFSARYLRQPPLALRWEPAVVAFCILAALMHGSSFSTYHTIIHFARFLRATVTASL